MRTYSSGVLVLFLVSGLSMAAAGPIDAKAEINSFNNALDIATKRMDNAAVLALWQSDGVSLLPLTPPIIGKKAVENFFNEVTAKHPGGRMIKFEMHCHNIEVSGDWGSEWCTEHQIVKLRTDEKPFEGWGKMLLILHRDANKSWRIKEEMWNQAPAASE